MCDSAGELDFEPSSVRCRNLVGGSPNSFIVFWAKVKSARSLRLLSVASVWGGGGGVIHIIFLQRNPSLLPEQVRLHGRGLRGCYTDQGCCRKGAKSSSVERRQTGFP